MTHAAAADVGGDATRDAVQPRSHRIARGDRRARTPVYDQEHVVACVLERGRRHPEPTQVGHDVVEVVAVDRSDIERRSRAGTRGGHLDSLWPPRVALVMRPDASANTSRKVAKVRTYGNLTSSPTAPSTPPRRVVNHGGRSCTVNAGRVADSQPVT